MEAIIKSMTDVTAMVGEVFTVITSNPYFLFMLAAGLIPIGIGLFKSIKHAAKK